MTEHYRDYGYASTEDAYVSKYVWPVVLRALSERLAIRRVLELGCGNGSFAGLLAGKGYEVSATDLSESGIDIARLAHPNVSFRKASVYEDLSGVWGRPFDAIIALEVVEHLYDPRQFLRRATTCMEEGGILILSTPYHGYLKNVALSVLGRFDRHFDPLWDGGHIKFWSKATLGQLLTEAGLQMELWQGAGRLPLFWKSMILVGRMVRAS
jgi:2-polyprenyl-6-hydroxyphenyl methylase/3-demethylubiquinone-9 3-methyltransferase